MPTAVVIAQEGDIHVYIKDELRGMNHEYRCSRVVLRSTSKYFSVLLDPEKFSEGIAIEARLQELSRKYVSLAAKPRSELPVVIISDVGQFPKDCAEIITAVRVFLDILHHHDGAHWPAISRAHSINLVALLAILADRFSSLEKVAGYLKRRGLETALLKDGKSTTPHKTELENRQRMLAGMLFGLPEWVRQCSAALIVEGPTRRTTTNLDSSEDEDPEGDEALWWRLPGGIEEELACRREYALYTLDSLQKHFINLYTSRQPQCKLGYGSSPQCDSYQLGEMIRFFSRKGLLRMDGAFAPAPEELEPYNGSLNDIIFKLKETPSYQIDTHHAHCGLRTRLIPILESLSPSRQVEMCLACWKNDKYHESWAENPTRGKCNFERMNVNTRGCHMHRKAKTLYTAEERNWTPINGL